MLPNVKLRQHLYKDCNKNFVRLNHIRISGVYTLPKITTYIVISVTHIIQVWSGITKFYNNVYHTHIIFSP